MVYKMRFIQNFDNRDTDVFLTLEKNFIELERRTASMANGKRFVPVIGREPTNTMIWEAEFDSLEAAVEALQAIKCNDEHDTLLNEQIQYMRDSYVEILKEMD